MCEGAGGLVRWTMTQIEYARKLDELERLLNDPDVSLEPGRVWSLLDEIAVHAPEPGPAVRPAG